MLAECLRLIECHGHPRCLQLVAVIAPLIDRHQVQLRLVQARGQVKCTAFLNEGRPTQLRQLLPCHSQVVEFDVFLEEAGALKLLDKLLFLRLHGVDPLKASCDFGLD